MFTSDADIWNAGYMLHGESEVDDMYFNQRNQDLERCLALQLDCLFYFLGWPPSQPTRSNKPHQYSNWRTGRFCIVC